MSIIMILINCHYFNIQYLSRISVVDVLVDTAFPGPVIVFALTLNVTTVFGGRSVSVYCVADVLV